MTFLLLALLVQGPPAPEPSEAAKKAVAELAAVKKDIEALLGFRDKDMAIRKKLQQGSDEPEILKKLAAEREALMKEFTALRDAAVKRMDALIVSVGEDLKKTPDDPGLIEVRRDANMTYGRPAEALPDTEKLARLRPKDAELQVKLAKLQHGLNRFEPAAATLEAALKGDPKNLELRRLHAFCVFASHRFEEAIAALEAILKETLKPEEKEQAEQYLEMARKSAVTWTAEKPIREKEAKADDLPRVKLTTSRGDIEIELFENEAPNTVANFIELIEKKFYDGLVFHRVLPAFMAQGGDPKGNGSGDAGYRFKDELGPSCRKHFRGSLAMANSGPDTNGSQFFITHVPTGWLDGKHTVFGRVLKGQETADLLQAGDKILKAEILRKRDHPYKAVKVGDEGPK
jgi:cyclophilin family peptidyl-prolyl cis-trans isomerase/predicted Zn-dependent protease